MFCTIMHIAIETYNNFIVYAHCVVLLVFFITISMYGSLEYVVFQEYDSVEIYQQSSKKDVYANTYHRRPASRRIQQESDQQV